MVLQSTPDTHATAPRGKLTHAEILQQPTLWPTTLEAVRKSAWQDDKVNRPVIISGAGTSAYAATAIAALWPNARAIPTTDLLLESSDEIEKRSPAFGSAGLLLSIGRSGDSPESIAVVKQMRRMFPSVTQVAITCNADGLLANTPGVHAIILDPRTNDRSLAMTSSFSNLVLAGLSLRHSDELEKILPSRCAEIQERLSDLDARAKQLSSRPAHRVVVLASGALRALATETSLKILELTAGRIVTHAETFLGLRHGPMSFMNSETLALCFLSSASDTRRYEQDLLIELRQKRLGYIVGIAPENADTSLFDEWIPAGAGLVRDGLRVPFEIPFAQLLAYHLSLNEGLDPDNPSPTGAITRVVQKFRIYDESSG